MMLDYSLNDPLKVKKKLTKTISLSLPIELISELDQMKKSMSESYLYQKFTKSKIIRIALAEWMSKIKKQLEVPNANSTN